MVWIAGAGASVETLPATSGDLAELRLYNRSVSGAFMGSSLIDGLFVFMLAGFIGFEVIKRISPLLHTPLMSITNALDAIAVVGAIVLVGRHESPLARILGILAVIEANSNIVGGFLITDRMLKMFKSSRPTKS